MSLEATLKELEDELEKKRVEVIHMKASINTRLEEQHAIETELTDRIREAIAEERKRSDQQRRESSDHNAIRLVQINMEMDALRAKIDDLSAREQLGAAGLVRLSSTLTELESNAKRQLHSEMQPLVAAATQLLNDARRNVARLVPILGESEAAAAAERSLASLITSKRDEDLISLQQPALAAGSQFGKAHEERIVEDEYSAQSAQQPNFIGGPMDFTTMQRESCVNSIALLEGANTTKKAVVAFAKEVKLEFQLFAGLYRRENERKLRMLDEIKAQTEALEVAQVVAKDLADSLLTSQEKLKLINERVSQLTAAVNAESSNNLEKDIEETRRLAQEKESASKAAAAKVKTAKSELEDIKQSLKKAVQATELASSDLARSEQQKHDLEQQLQKVTTEASNAKQKMHSAEDKIQLLESQKIRLLRSIGDAELAKEAASDKLKSKESELADAESKLRIAKSSASSREELIEPLKAKLNDVLIESETLKKEISALETAQSTATVAAEDLVRQIAIQRSANDDKEKEIEYIRTILAARGSASVTPTSESLQPLATIHQSSTVASEYRPAQSNQSQYTGDESRRHSLQSAGSLQPQIGIPSTNGTATTTMARSHLDAPLYTAQRRDGSRRPSGADAYLQTLKGSPELVRSSKSPSVASVSAAEGSHNVQSAAAHEQRAVPHTVAYGAAATATGIAAVSRPKRRNLTDEYGFGYSATDANVVYNVPSDQQPTEVMSAMDRLKQRYTMGREGGDHPNQLSSVPPPAAPSIANINSRLSAILERKNKRINGTGGFY